MEFLKMRDLYCYECFLQFEKKYVFDIHLSTVHGEDRDAKQEPDINQVLVIPEAKELKRKHPVEETSWENLSGPKSLLYSTF